MLHVQNHKKHLQLAIIFYHGLVVKIHSSSLYIEPAGSRQSTSLPVIPVVRPDDKTNNTRNLDETPPSSNAQFAKAIVQKQAQELVATPSLSDNTLNIRTSKALNAYSSTFNQLSQQQIEMTVSGIDFFV